MQEQSAQEKRFPQPILRIMLCCGVYVMTMTASAESIAASQTTPRHDQEETVTPAALLADSEVELAFKAAPPTSTLDSKTLLQLDDHQTLAATRHTMLTSTSAESLTPPEELRLITQLDKDSRARLIVELTIQALAPTITAPDKA